MRTVTVSGEFTRVADPDWDDPLDGSWAQRRGGRWNAPGSYATVYLNGNETVARLNARKMLRERTLEGMPFSLDDMDPRAMPVLVTAWVEESKACDCVTNDGLVACGLPVTYSRDADGAVMGHDACQPVGARAFDAGVCGVLSRSALEAAEPRDIELAWFPAHGGALTMVGSAVPFTTWFGQYGDSVREAISRGAGTMPQRRVRSVVGEPDEDGPGGDEWDRDEDL